MLTVMFWLDKGLFEHLVGIDLTGPHFEPKKRLYFRVKLDVKLSCVHYRIGYLLSLKTFFWQLLEYSVAFENKN